MDKKILKREYISSTMCELGDDNYWKAYSKIVDRVLYEGETEWVEEVIDAVSYDQDVQNAIQTSMGSTLHYMFQTVYQSGFKGLVEYKEFERQLKDAKQPQSIQA